jgi:hypothetical protein
MTAEVAKPVLNISDVPLMERAHGDKFAAKWGRIGPQIGSTGLGCALHVVPPGKRAFPMHRHHVIEELFYVISGEGEYRWGDKTFPANWKGWAAIALYVAVVLGLVLSVVALPADLPDGPGTWQVVTAALMIAALTWAFVRLCRSKTEWAWRWGKQR